MRIGIDYTAAVWQGGGIGRYTRELVAAAVALGEGFEYRLFYAAGGLPSASPYLSELRQLCMRYPQVRAFPIPLTPNTLTRLWQRLRLPLPIELLIGRVDRLHAPDFALPPTRARTLVTIHDLSFMLFPQFYVPGLLRYLNMVVPYALRRANLVLVDSRATGQDLERLLGVTARRIQVIYPGVAPHFRPLPPAESAPLRAKLNLPAQFLLFVSTISPRKNLVRLLEAFAQQRTHFPDLHLILAGQKGWMYDDVFASIARLGLHPRVRVLDFVDDKDLPALYNLALASVYPSVYEGFGLPALEALACGSPLVTANNSSLPEVVGSAALLAEATDVSALAAALGLVAGDAAVRQRLRLAGPVQAAAFTWERAARQLLECYRMIE